MKNILIYDSLTPGKIEYPLEFELKKLGYKAHTFDYIKYFINPNSFFQKVINKVNYRLTKQKINFNLINLVKGNSFDLMIICYGKHLDYKTIKTLKGIIPVIVNWNSDDIFNKLNTSKDLIKSISLFDIHFTPRIHLIEEYKRHGAKKFIELDWYYRSGYLKESIKKQQLDEVYFAGSYSDRRNQIISNINHNNINISGSGWIDKKGKNLMGNANFDQMHENFSTHKFNINILTKENRDTSNLRNFEIPSSFGFQLSERNSKIQSLFDEDKEIVLFETIEELNDKIDFYSRNESAREAMIYNAHKRLIKSDYSLRARLKTILKEVYEL